MRTTAGWLGTAWAELALAGCGPAASRPAAAAPLAVPASPSAPAPAASPAPATPSAPAPRRLTEAQLTSALLTLDDVPSGFARDNEKSDEDTDLASSADASCAGLVRLMNESEAPGAVASALVGFDGGQDGPYLGEQLEAFAGGD